VLENQPRVRGCTVMPVRAEDALGHEYLPEEEVDEAHFAAILTGICDPGLHEAIDLTRLHCAAGPCPP
jgi:ribonucleoside-triphosphate reductase (formate)